MYGLGATLLFLLSGRPPSAFPLQRMRLDLSGVRMGPQLDALLEGLLEPAVEDRLAAEEALALLKGAPLPPATARAVAGASAGSGASGASPPGLPRPPAGSRIRMSQRGSRLEVDIPPSGLTGDTVDSGIWVLVWSSLSGSVIMFALQIDIVLGPLLLAPILLPLLVTGKWPSWVACARPPVCNVCLQH